MLLMAIIIWVSTTSKKKKRSKFATCFQHLFVSLVHVKSYMLHKRIVSNASTLNTIKMLNVKDVWTPEAKWSILNI